MNIIKRLFVISLLPLLFTSNSFAFQNGHMMNGDMGSMNMMGINNGMKQMNSNMNKMMNEKKPKKRNKLCKEHFVQMKGNMGQMQGMMGQMDHMVDKDISMCVGQNN